MDRICKFTFYRSFHDALQKLPDSERLALYDAICFYAFEDAQASLEDPLADMAWTVIEPHIAASKAGQINGGKRVYKGGVDTPPPDPPSIPPLLSKKKKERERVNSSKKLLTQPAGAGADADGSAPRPSEGDKMREIFEEVERRYGDVTDTHVENIEKTVMQRDAAAALAAGAVPCPEDVRPFTVLKGGASCG